MFDKYVGLFIEDERPCWKLVRMVLSEQAGKNFPSYDEDDTEGHSIAGHAASYPEVKLQDARALDVAILMTANLENGKYIFRPLHVGIFCNSFQILHINKGQQSVVQFAKELKIHSILRVT